jgi:hypothetical protein
MELVEAQAAKALDQLRAEGWTVGPPEGRDEWRRAVRSAARASGLRVRTGEASGRSSSSDGRPRPWAITPWLYETMRGLMGGATTREVGATCVDTDAERRRGLVAGRAEELG